MAANNVGNSNVSKNEQREKSDGKDHIKIYDRNEKTIWTGHVVLNKHCSIKNKNNKKKQQNLLKDKSKM